jgi:hypothetical protein
MIKLLFNLLKIEMEIWLGKIAILIKSMFDKRPETFDALSMIPSFGQSLLFYYHSMVASNGEKCIYKPVMSVIETTSFIISSN